MLTFTDCSYQRTVKFLFMASNQHLETEIQLLTLKMPQTDFLKVRKCVFVEKKVTVVAAVDAISIYNLTAEKSCFAVKI